ncbi:MAG: hypothetical protein FWF06_08010 [Symbiobacteriaceae bacterium]|nr:hypothetical protein [Symbiobacteriaceae bacterium]
MFFPNRTYHLARLTTLGMVLILALSSCPLYSAEVNPLPVLPTVVAIAAGELSSVALNSRGELYTWGFNWNGQLGDGMDGWGLAKPKPGLILRQVASIAVGAGHTLALDNTGTLYAFGQGWDGQIGSGAAGMRSVQRKPLAIMTDVSTMAAGAAHSLVVTQDGALYVFGRNRNGELGLGHTTSQTRPQLTAVSDVAYVSAGDRHSLALLTDGTLLAWGDNYAGQLGTGDRASSLHPVEVMKDVRQAYAGRINSFAITQDGALWGWGSGIASLRYQGADPQEVQLTPQKLMNGVKEVAIGASHLLILTEDGTLFVSGENWLGQLGVSAATLTVPQQLQKGITTIAAGGWHSLAVDEKGDLLVWGDNSYGQLGNMNFNSLTSPTRIQVSDLFPSVLYNGSGAGWFAVRPILAVDRIVLQLEPTFRLLEIPYRLLYNRILQFEYQGDTYLHLIGSHIFYLNGKLTTFALATLVYQGEVVFQAFDSSDLFNVHVRWDPTAQLLILDSE